jgi:serine/threonine protein kinase/Tol biopolymer transport system component
MSLSAGARLGVYEVIALLGAGGMGEVYKARDTRLDRTVAIKILPDALATDPQFRDRFDREARTISQLDHPQICALYDVGEQGGTAYLVMQYLEGETLADRLTKGALPLDQALQVAIQIADALATAHKAGIVHRDLKPGNIMLTKGGAKLLDFGLAKTGASALGGANLSMLPTTPPVTQQGSILGTFQYMAPEQLEGQEADARTDIFAFGVVLYEMITGQKAFEGKTQASVIGAILKDQPPLISTLQPLTPPALDHLVATCLAKDPDERWQTARDLTREIKWSVRGGSQSSALAAVVAPPKGVVRSMRFAWVVAAVSIAMGALLAIPALRHLRESTPEPLQMRFEVQTPPTSDSGSFALSPDGRQLAFVATAEGAPRLWVRSVDQVVARALPGTDGAAYPFWAPDSQAIGFFANGKLKRIDLSGGTPQTLADAPGGRGGTWNREGVIVFVPNAQLTDTRAVLMRVAATGGIVTPVTHLAAGQSSHRWPQFLPDGRRLLFLVTSGKPDTQGAYLGSLDGGEPTRVLAADTGVLFAPPNSLLLVRQDALIAVRFDAVRGTVSGDTVTVAQGVGVDTGVFRGAFSVSSADVLAYRTGSGSQRRQLLWVNRSGTQLGTIGPSDENGLASPELAPDGRRVAVVRSAGGNFAVWLIDIGRGVPSRFTFDPFLYQSPVWSPDGLRVAFSTTRSGVYDLFEKPASGAGDEQQILVAAESKAALSWSPDGRFLLYGTQDPKTGADLWALPLMGERKPFPVVRTPFEEAAGQFSPDGRWVAYQSNESGRTEIYVRPFPGPAGQWQVSTAGGSQPRWRPDGKELFYVAPDARLMAVPMSVEANSQTLEPGAPVPLFPTRLASGANILSGALSKAQYAVAPDGRFLLNAAVDEGTASPITVVLNWDAALKK